MKRLLLLILFSIAQLTSFAMFDGKEYSNNLSYSNGLVGETIRKMCLDHLNRAWLVTYMGVNVFNGVQVQAFRLKDEKGNAVRPYDVCEGMDKSIFVATNNGLYELKRGKWNFVNVLSNIGQAENLFYDGKVLYIGSHDGLFVYDGKYLKKVNMGNRPHLDYLPRCFQKDSQGNVWLSTRYTLSVYSPKTGKLVSQQLAKRLPYNTFLGNFVFYKQSVYIGSNQGLFRFDKKTGNVETVKGIGPLVSSVSISHDNLLCVGTKGSGAYILSAENGGVVRHFGTKEMGVNYLPTDLVDYFLQDRNGVNWFGVARYGAVYTYYNSLLFKPYTFDGFSSSGLDVRCFSKQGGEVLIGTQNGLYYINGTKGVWKYFPPLELNGAHMITKIAPYAGKYYIGTFDGGLLALDPQTLSVTSSSALHPLLGLCSVNEMKVSPSGKLCIGTNEGLFVLDGQNHCTRYAEQNSRICGGDIYSMVFDHAGNTWICGASELCLYLAGSKDFETSLFPKGFFNKDTGLRMSNGHGQRLFAISQNLVYETNEKMTRFGKVKIPSEFSEDICRFFLDDMRGYYWMASEKGLFRLNYSFSEMQHFGNSEGVKGGNVNDAYMDEKGTLWLCTSKGLFFAQRADLEKWRSTERGKVQVYHVRIGENMIGDGQETVVNDKATMTIPWNVMSSPLVLTPILVDYSKESGRLYEYNIDGKKEWRLVQEGKEIKVSSLFLGKHHLKIRLLGLPNTERNYCLEVIPSVAAILEAMFFVLALSLFFWWRRYHKSTRALLSEKTEMEDALIEMEQKNVEMMMKQETEDPLAQQKYARVRMDEQECAQIVEKMREYIEKDKIYTNPDLKMADLASSLGLSSSKLSFIFNLYLKENYYEFINRYRLEEFKRLIAEGNCKRYTLTALSEKCGFKKTSFFSTFRRVEGMTPMEYLKRQNIKF